MSTISSVLTNVCIQKCNKTQTPRLFHYHRKYIALHLDTYFLKGSCAKNHSNIEIKFPSQYSSKLSTPVKWWNSLEKPFTEEFHCLAVLPSPAAGDSESCLLKLKTVSLFSWTSGILACMLGAYSAVVKVSKSQKQNCWKKTSSKNERTNLFFYPNGPDCTWNLKSKSQVSSNSGPLG